MTNRADARGRAIDASVEATEDGKLTSRFVYQASGVSNDPKVVAAIDRWANVYGEEIYPTMNHTGLYDDSDPLQVAAMEKLNLAEEALKKLLPNVKFLDGQINFDGGFVTVSV